MQRPSVDSKEFVELELPSDQPIGFKRPLSHRSINGQHLWISVEKGAVLVLSESEAPLFAALEAGVPPAALLSQVGLRDVESNILDRWEDICGLIHKCAAAGFLEQLDGYWDECRLAPERFARLHLTARCQLRCIHCYAVSGPQASTSGELATDRWVRLIDDIAASGGESVLFTGGEPLLRPDCGHLMEHAASLGLGVTLFTNGLLVRRHLDAIRRSASLVQVSLNGPDAQTNDAIRGSGTFAKVLQAVDGLADAGVPVRIGMTVMERNWPAIRDLFPQFTRRFSGKPVRFHLGYGVCNYGRATELHDQLELDQIRPVLDCYLEEANGGSDRRIARRTTRCGYCEQLVIAPDGGVYPCHLLAGRLGHIDERSVGEWHQVLRELAVRHEVDHVSGCNTCDLRHLCGGTCRVINEVVTGSRWVTTCTPVERTARYRNLVRLFARGGDGSLAPVSARCE